MLAAACRATTKLTADFCTTSSNSAIKAYIITTPTSTAAPWSMRALGDFGQFLVN